MSSEWIEQPLTAEERERNWLWLQTTPQNGANGRDRWAAGPSHADPTFGDQWFDRETGRCWTWKQSPADPEDSP